MKEVKNYEEHININYHLVDANFKKGNYIKTQNTCVELINFIKKHKLNIQLHNHIVYFYMNRHSFTRKYKK